MAGSTSGYSFQYITGLVILAAYLGLTVEGKESLQTLRGKRFLNKLEGDSNLKKVGIAKPGSGLGGFGYLVYGRQRQPTTAAPKKNENADEPIIGENFSSTEVCFDLVIVLDISCSVSSESKKYAQNIIKSILSSFPLNAERGIRINLVTFAEEVIQTIYFDPSKTAAELHLKIDELEINPPVCRTNTWQALKAVNALFFSEDLNENDGIRHGPKMLIIVGDGRGSPKSKEKLTEIYTENLIKDNVTMIWIETNLDSDKRKARIETEIDLIMSEEAVLHMKNDTDISAKVIQYLQNASVCDSIRPRIKPNFSPT